jgi:hypothetical protein
MQATAIYEQKELQPDRKQQRKVAEKNQQIQKDARKMLENHLIMNSLEGCKHRSVLARRVLYSSTKKEKTHDANE